MQRSFFTIIATSSLFVVPAIIFGGMALGYVDKNHGEIKTSIFSSIPKFDSLTREKRTDVKIEEVLEIQKQIDNLVTDKSLVSRLKEPQYKTISDKYYETMDDFVDTEIIEIMKSTDQKQGFCRFQALKNIPYQQLLTGYVFNEVDKKRIVSKIEEFNFSYQNNADPFNTSTCSIKYDSQYVVKSMQEATKYLSYAKTNNQIDKPLLDTIKAKAKFLYVTSDSKTTQSKANEWINKINDLERQYPSIR